METVLEIARALRSVQGMSTGKLHKQLFPREQVERDEFEALLTSMARGGYATLENADFEKDGRIVGHVLFSRLLVDPDGTPFDAVSLAPLAVDPDYQGQGVGSALVRRGHELLKERGEKLSIVVGDPAYYGRFGYARAGAEKFTSDYQGDAMQALYWGEAPTSGQLAHPRAFAGW